MPGFPPSQPVFAPAQCCHAQPPASTRPVPPPAPPAAPNPGGGQCPGVPCIEACVCPTPFVSSASRCVHPLQCGCTRPDRQHYAPPSIPGFSKGGALREPRHPSSPLTPVPTPLQVGESWMDDANCTRRCTCRSPENIACEAWSCLPGQECSERGRWLGCHDTRESPPQSWAQPGPIIPILAPRAGCIRAPLHSP